MLSPRNHVASGPENPCFAPCAKLEPTKRACVCRSSSLPSPCAWKYFSVFAPGGVLSPFAILDDEGEKFVPRVCIACHNGAFEAGRADLGAVFREFEPSLLETPDGGSQAAAPSAPAPEPGRLQDFVRLTTAQAARKADRVALVRAGGSQVVEGAPGIPFTRTAFAVEDVAKGRLPHRFVLQVIGGRIGNSVVESPVQAFRPAHRYILFLGPDGPAGPTIFPQSVIEVKGDARAALAPVRSALR